MHWSEKIAKDIIKRSPDKEEYVCAAGISPSGSIHIGNFRDIATSYFALTLPAERRVQAKLAVKDEYTFDFAELSPEYSEHVNIVQIMTYYSLGRWIVETQQMGEKRAKYLKIKN